MFELVMLTNIVIGIYNLRRSQKQYKQGEYSYGDWSFFFGIMNIMVGLGMVVYEVFRILVA